MGKEMSQQERQEQMLSLEKLMGWLMAAVLALLSWNVYTTQQLSVSVAVIEERTAGFNYAQLETRVGSLETWTQNLSNRLKETQNEVLKLGRENLQQ